MWTTEYAQTSTAAPEQVWAALTDLHSGIPIGPGSDSFVLHGPFAVGTEVSITPVGGPTLRSTITELEPQRVYADVTEHDGLRLTFRHTLQPADHGTIVTHRLEIDGTAADVAGPQLGPQIAADFPQAMGELLASAEARA